MRSFNWGLLILVPLTIAAWAVWGLTLPAALVNQFAAKIISPLDYG